MIAAAERPFSEKDPGVVAAYRAAGAPITTPVKRRPLAPTKAPPEVKIAGKVRRWLDLLIDGVPFKGAAEQAGIRIARARKLLTHPVIRREYEAMVEVLKSGERARNIHVAVSIRDDETLKSPAGRKVQLDAAKYLDGVDGDSTRASGGVNVNVSIVGYVMDLTGAKSGPRVIEHDAGDGVRNDGEA